MKKITVRVYKPKRNTRVKIGITPENSVYIIFQSLKKYTELTEKDKQYYTQIIRPKKSNLCITVLKVHISKESFTCIGHFLSTDFYHKFMKDE